MGNCVEDIGNTSERFMSMFAEQGRNNVVTGIDVEGLVQRLLLFDHCIIPSVWLRDVQLLLQRSDPDAFCELIDSGALSFYIDSATAAEVGQSRDQLKLTGNTTRLQDNEFHFVTLKGHDDPERVSRALGDLSKTHGVFPHKAKRVAERVEAFLLEPKGLVTVAEGFKGFYSELRSPDSTAVKTLVAGKLTRLGAKPKGLNLTVEEFVPEDFRVKSNLTTKFGLTPRKARQMCLEALLELSSVYMRLAHMREFSCLLGIEEKEQTAWNLKADSLVRSLSHEPHNRERQFMRVAQIAGLGERALIRGESIDLARLITLRQSDDLALFRDWLRSAEVKSDQEIRERLRSVRSKIGNSMVGAAGRVLRVLLTNLPGLIPNPAVSIPAGLLVSGLDSFLLERLAPKDAVVGVLVKEYPAILG